MTEPKDWPAPRIAAAAVLGAAFVATVAVNWPGHLSYDSAEQLLEGRVGLYNTWHPPVMAWLLGVFDRIVPGAGLFVLFDAALGFGALFALMLLGRVRWRTVAVGVGIAFLPQMLLYQGVVWKDVLFADAAVAGFVCLAVTAARWRTGGEAAAVGMFLLLSLGALTRQNGLVVLPFATGALFWIARWHGGSRRTALVAAGGGLAVMIVIVAAATLALERRSNGDSGPAEQMHVLAFYDLSGAVAANPGLRMDVLVDDDPDLEATIRTRGATLWSPVRNDPIMSDPAIQEALTNPHGDTDALVAQWRALIADHPWTYMRVRAADFLEVFATPDIAAARPVFTGVEAPASLLDPLRIAPRKDGRDRVLEAYGKALFGTPVWSHVTFAAAAIACLVLMLRRRNPTDIAIAALLASALAFSASFFIISISCDYRYLYFLDLSALAALFYLSLDTDEAA
jgi:hypothetical protein